MNWFDFLLGMFTLAVVPFFLAAYGGHLAAQALADPKARRNAKFIFWGLCLLGVFVAALYQYRVGKTDEAREYRAAQADLDRERKTDELQRETLKAQADLRAIEETNRDQIHWLQNRLDKVLANAQSPDQSSSAKEIKNELSEMAETLRQQTVPTKPTNPIISSMTQPATPPTPSKPCRGDNLSECSDEELLEWGKPLIERVDAIEKAHMENLKELDEIKGNWIGFLIGKDKDSKWLKAYAEAQENAADQFRDCCAEDTLNYHKELARRTGGGLQKDELYDWILELMKPVKSKAWKAAREEGGSKIVNISGDLLLLQIELGQRIRTSKTKKTVQ